MAKEKILFLSSILSITAGIAMVLGGIGGIVYPYTSIAAESIITPKDATIPNAPVRGPLTLKSQADVILLHTLTSTEGKRFAQMPRTLPKLDAAGNPVLDEKGAPVMAPNEKRSTWFNAVALMTALQLGMLTYAFSALSFVLGLLFLLNGYVFCALRKS